MRRLLFIVALFFALFSIGASATTVTGTVTDSDSVAWAGGSITFNLIGNGGPPFYCAGTLMSSSQTSVSATLDASGAFSVTLCDNTTITPVNSKWAIQIQSAATASPQNLTPTSVSGSSQSLTSYINGLIKPIRISGSQQITAYTDTEISLPKAGTTYYSLTAKAIRIYDGTTWTSIGATSSFTKISTQVLASPAASVTFSAIPNTYTNLKLLINARSPGSSASNANVLMQFNGDTGANYDWIEVASAATFNGIAATAGNAGNISISSSPAGASGSLEITINNYAATTFWKNAVTTNAYEITAATPVSLTDSIIWKSTAAITSIAVGDNGSTFATGSTFTLYGMN